MPCLRAFVEDAGAPKLFNGVEIVTGQGDGRGRRRQFHTSVKKTGDYRRWNPQKNGWFAEPNGINILSGFSIKVGSDSHRDVVIPHPSVEGWHCELEMDRETHRMWIVNMTETDKVIVTGDKMEPYSKRRIFLGEHFQVGNLESTMALEATPWPNAIMPPETDVESDTDCSSDGNDEILSELPIERNAHFKNTKSSNGTEVFITKEGILRTPSLSLSAKHPSTNQKGKEGVLGSASKYFPYGIPSENQPNEAEYKVTTGPLSVETQERLLATPSPTTRIVSGKSSEEVMSEKMKSFPPPRRTGIAKVYRHFYSTKPPMMPEPRVTQANSVREMDESLLPLPEQTTSDSWTEQKIYEEIEHLCLSSEKHMDVEPNEGTTNELLEPTLDVIRKVLASWERGGPSLRFTNLVNRRSLLPSRPHSLAFVLPIDRQIKALEPRSSSGEGEAPWTTNYPHDMLGRIGAFLLQNQKVERLFYHRDD
ncbi:hypothetical protein EJ110_NYTH25918 [Nymphaea thermarum]|nr:hypothetical protein EJ110_NYTH25918 [Nymphaea thermarum]